MRLDVSEAKEGDSYDGMKIDATGIGAMRLQIGANEGQVLEVNIPAVTLQNMGIEDIDVNTQEGAKDAISRVDGAIKYVSSVRGRLGAFQNRLESSINSLDVTSENMTAAYSRIMDVDMAGGNDLLHYLSDSGTGRDLHAGPGKRETVPGVTAVA